MDKTVLIIGAGLSVPYGYPSGDSLVRGIVKKWRSNNAESERPLRELAQQLFDADAPSIDRFLSEHERHSRAGISAIVGSLLDAESQSLAHEVDDQHDVFRLLLKQIDESNFENIKVISFNYDRYFEWRFFRKIRTQCDSDEEAHNRAKKIQIEHIHGRMVPFSSSEAECLKRDRLQYVPYGFDKVEYR